MKNARWSPANDNHAPAKGTRDGGLFLEHEIVGSRARGLVITWICCGTLCLAGEEAECRCLKDVAHVLWIMRTHAPTHRL